MERGLGVAVDRAGRRQDLGQQLTSSLYHGVPDLAPGVRNRDSRDSAVAIVLVGSYEPPSGQAAYQPADGRDLRTQPIGDLGHGCALFRLLTHDHENAPLGKRQLQPNGGESSARDGDRAECHRFESVSGSSWNCLCLGHRQTILDRCFPHGNKSPMWESTVGA